MNQDIFPDSWHKSVTLSEACRHATKGIKLAFKTERNLTIQITIYILALALALLLKLSFLAIAIVTIAATLVITLELINTALEHFSDLLEPRYSATVRLIKDIAAGSVLIAGIASALIGLLLFLPPIILSFF